MPYISRQVGTVSSLITVFLADRTVSTGAGLANVVASTVRFSWLRSDMSAVSSWTLTTGTLGTWAASTMTQVGSTSTLGAYQFSLPNGLFASGDTAYAQIMSSTAMFAEVPLVIELTKTDNQTYMSSQVIGSASSVRVPVGVSTITVAAMSSFFTLDAGDYSTSVLGSVVQEIADNVSATVGAQVGVSSISIPVGVSTITAGVLSTHSVSSVLNEGGLIHRGTAVSSTASTIDLDVTLSTYANDVLTGAIVFVKSGTGAGQSRVLDDWTSTASKAHISPNWTVNPTSTSVYEIHAAAPGSSSTFPSVTLASTSIMVGASTVTAAVNVTSVYGSAFVTSAAGVLGPSRVSSVSVPVGVSTLTVAAMSSFFTLDAGDYSTSVLGSVVQEIADNVSATVGAQVGVSSISIPVGVSTIAAGTLSTHSISSVLNETGVIAKNVTASSVTASSVVLALTTGAADRLVGATIFVRAGAGVHQSRRIVSWVVATSTAIISPAWASNPDGSTLEIIAGPPYPTSSNSRPTVDLASTAIMVGVSTVADGALSTHSISSVLNEPGLIHRGTTVSSTASTIQLDATLSTYPNDSPAGSIVFIKSGPGAGQARVLDDWTSTGSVGHISPNWTVNPTSTSVYEWHAAAPGSTSSTPLVTIASTQILLGVSTVSTPVTASSVTAGVATSTITVSAMSSFFTLDAGDYSTSVLGSVVQEIADNVSATVGAQVGVSSISIPVSVSSVTAAVNVSALHGSLWVTSAAGVPGPLRVSSISTPVSASSVTAPVGISTITVAAMSSFFTLDAGDYSTSVLGSVVQEIADNVSATVGAQVGVSSISIPVSVSSVTAAVNVSAIHGSPWVTSAAGVPGPLAVSTVSTPVTASSVTAAVNVSSLYGSGWVTSAAGVVGPVRVSSVSTPVSASSVTAPVGVSTLTVAALSSMFTLDAGDYSTAALGSVVKEIADNVSATVGAQVGVSSISIPVSVSSVSVTVSANIVKVNNGNVTGTGQPGDEWGPA